LKFSDNELIWKGELRIDIPRWPDWVKEFPLTVVPSATEAPTIATLPAFGAGAGAGGQPLTPEEEAWFDEVVQQITDSESDRDRLRAVLAAVQDQVFGIRVDVLEQMTEPPDSASRLGPSYPGSTSRPPPQPQRGCGYSHRHHFTSASPKPRWGIA
jgi:hypothetical protein